MTEAKLKDLKAGDKVLISRGHGSLTRGVVAKVGKLHIIVGESKYAIRGGRNIHSSTWSGEYLRPFDEKEWESYVAERDLRRMLNEIAGVNWRQVSPDIMKQVHAILFPTPPQKGN